MNTDYIPGRYSELVFWSYNFSNQIAGHISDWDIPEQDVLDLQVAASEYATLQAQADSPAKNPVIVAQRNASRKQLVSRIRGLVNFRLKNPVITDVQRVEMGLHVRDTTQSNISEPVSIPELNVEVHSARHLKVAFRDTGSMSKAKPYGVIGAVIAFAILDAPPASHAALTRYVLATRTPFTLEFAEQERGKTVYIAICWQNKKGKKGPWSNIESAFVP